MGGSPWKKKWITGCIRNLPFGPFAARMFAPASGLRSPAFAGMTACLLGSLAHADTGVGVDTWRGNKLDPTAGTQSETPDERGTSWLVPGERRTPTGNLYLSPSEPPQPDQFGDWQGYGILQLGLLGTNGDDTNALWNRYVDWDSGLILGLLDYTWQRPSDGSYANVRASRLSDDDQYYQAVFGRAGSYKIQAFLRDMPNVLSSNAKPIWNGVGTSTLTLPSSLTPGGSTPEQVAAVSAATPERQLKVKREKQGLGYSMYLTPQWTAYANVTDEQRTGARPYGGPFFFNYAYPGDGGVLETVKPIDDSTVNVNGGLRYAGPVWRMDFGYQGSFYRDRYTSYTYQTPFALTPSIPDAVSAPLTTGQMSTEPDNDYHNLQATFTRKIAWNGELSVTGSVGRMSQNDRLIAPINCQGVFGIGLAGSLQLGPQNPYLYNCADWNTSSALSRPNADMSIDTSMLDARIVLQPTSDLSLRGGFKFNREDYRNTYLAYNPLTGQYGYIAENGAQGSVVTGPNGSAEGGVGLWDPNNPSAITRVLSLPLDQQTMDANVGADWKLGAHNTIGATLDFTRDEPTNRERNRADDSSLKLTWVNRSVDWLTLRANATYLKQTGDAYDYDPYEFIYSTSLPGFVPPPGGVQAQSVDALRLYDLASRDEEKLDLMATIAPRDDMTISLSARGDWNSYDAQIGRQGYNTLGATVQWEWQPSPGTQASAYYGYDRSKLRMASVNDLGADPDPRLGGSTFPNDGRWWTDDIQRNQNAGATLTHTIGRVRIDASWTYLDAQGTTRYRFATPAALAYFADGFIDTNAFPLLAYRVNSLTLGVTIPLMRRVSMRLFDYYERAHVSDWHYAGLDAGYVIDHRVYTDGGPQSYSANLVGLLVSIEL
jgi:hypothetical protein